MSTTGPFFLQTQSYVTQSSPIGILSRGLCEYKSLSSEQTEQKIASLKAEQIACIGKMIVGEILSVSSRWKGLADYSKLNPQALMTLTDESIAYIEARKFSQSEWDSFLLSNILEAVNQRIAVAFSMPGGFCEHGLSFPLKDDSGCAGILKAAGEKMRLILNVPGLPIDYCIYLSLDAEATREKSALTFVLTEQSGETKFSETSFTVYEEQPRSRL